MYQIITLIKYYANPYKGKLIKLFKNDNLVKCFKYSNLSATLQTKILISFKILCYNQLERKYSNFRPYDHMGLRKIPKFQKSENYNSVTEEFILVPSHIRSWFSYLEYHNKDNRDFKATVTMIYSNKRNIRPHKKSVL